MSDRAGPGVILRYGLAAVQAIMGLFGAGSVIFAAHKLFLRYYANEWAGIQFSGVNGCAGEERIANGDLFEGQTFCNKPINFVPWIEVYRRHWQAAALYYGAALVVILLAGLIWHLVHRSRATVTPFGGAPKKPSAADSEHLR